MEQGRGRHILAPLLCILLMASVSFSGDLSIQGGFIYPPGFFAGAGWGFKPLAGNFLLAEVAVGHAQGEAPVEPLDMSYPPGSSYEEYGYSRWSDTHAVGRLKLQGIVPHNPFYFALGIGIGAHFVGAKKDYWYDTNWHYQWQFRGHGFVQLNVRLDAEMSVFTEIEVTSDFRDLHYPETFPQRFGALKFGLRVHSIGRRIQR